MLTDLNRFVPAWSAIESPVMVFALTTTVRFLFTTPGLDLQGSDAGFLPKDEMLLGVALWCAGESLADARARRIPGAEVVA